MAPIEDHTAIAYVSPLVISSKVKSEDGQFQRVLQRCELSTPLFFSRWNLDCELVLK